MALTTVDSLHGGAHLWAARPAADTLWSIVTLAVLIAVVWLTYLHIEAPGREWIRERVGRTERAPPIAHDLVDANQP